MTNIKKELTRYEKYVIAQEPVTEAEKQRLDDYGIDGAMPDGQPAFTEGQKRIHSAKKAPLLSPEHIFLTTDDLSDRWECSWQSVAIWRKNDTGCPYMKIHGEEGSLGTVRYRLSDVMAWEESVRKVPKISHGKAKQMAMAKLTAQGREKQKQKQKLKTLKNAQKALVLAEKLESTLA